MCWGVLRCGAEESLGKGFGEEEYVTAGEKLRGNVNKFEPSRREGINYFRV